MQIDVQSLEIAARERGIDLDILVEAIQEALLREYLRIPGAVRGARAEINLADNTVTIWAPEVDEDGVLNGEFFDDTPSGFSRKAAYTVRSVISQRLRFAEDRKTLGGFLSRVGELVYGTIEPSKDPQTWVVRMADDMEAVLPPQEQVPLEDLRVGQPIRAILIEATQGNKGPRIVVSRTHPNLVRKLFELNCPEVQEGNVEIVSIAREAGYRSKIAVRPLAQGVNAKAACIGPMGTRVRAVVAELQGEKIDIVDWHEDIAKFVSASLSPAKVSSSVVVDRENRQARVLVPHTQLSLAIGKEGQNARIAARITGWKIDICSDQQNNMIEEQRGLSDMEANQMKDNEQLSTVNLDSMCSSQAEDSSTEAKN